jgi:predicted HicB family RNase H-like nuclease
MASPQTAPIPRRSKKRSLKTTQEPGSNPTGQAIQLVPASYRLKEPLHEKLRVYCFLAGISQNEFVTEAIEERLEKVVKTVTEERLRAMFSK